MKNLVAALMRDLPSVTEWPQSAIRKYIGTSIISQKKKKRNRSTAMKTPSTPPRIHSRLRWKKPMRWTISFQEQRMASTPMKLVRITIRSDSPSTARCREMPKRGIQGCCHSAAQTGRPGLARVKSQPLHLPAEQAADEGN